MTSIDRSHCTARRHGDMAAYCRAGCRCPDAREDHRLYYKRWREQRPYRRRVDATGTIRRLQALAANGWPQALLAKRIGISTPVITNLCRGAVPRCTPRTRDLVTRFYNQHADIAGPSSSARIRAAAKGWLSPQWWFDPAEMDDPTYNPLGVEPDPNHIDHVVVDRVLDNHDPGRPLNRAEKATVVRLGLARGLGHTTLARRLHLSGTAIHQLATQAA